MMVLKTVTKFDDRSITDVTKSSKPSTKLLCWKLKKCHCLSMIYSLVYSGAVVKIDLEDII